MISVEQLQKTNLLSKELKNFGFANNSETAYNMAEQLCEGQRERSGGESKPDANTESLKKISDLERTRVQMNKKLSDFTEQLNTISEKLEELSKAIKLVEMNQISFDKKLSEMTQKSGDRRKVDLPEPAPVAPEVVTLKAPERKPLDKPIDRNGVAPADVQIDKIFYAGRH